MKGITPMRKVPRIFWLTVMLFLFLSAGSIGSGFFFPDIRPGYGVPSQGWLSNYFAPLRGTPLDTPVFYLDSGKPGVTALVIGGTHGQEIAGCMAATVLIENVEVTQGRLIVIPYANRSAMSVQDQRNRIPRVHPINSKSGPRYLPYGDRLTDLADQGRPDPEKYVHPSGYELKDGAESRNLNRAYPGKQKTDHERPAGLPGDGEKRGGSFFELTRFPWGQAPEGSGVFQKHSPS